VSTAVEQRPAVAGSGNGGVPARRAVIRWAWRLLRREWRQQLLMLVLIMVAVAATFIGAAVASDTPPPAGAGFGTAQDMATFQSPGPHLAAQIAALASRFGRVDVIENQTLAIPGSIDTYDLRAQNPHGRYGQPMLSLVSGHYPSGPGQVAVTSGVAADFHLTVGGSWRMADGQTRRVTGIVQNPQSLLDEFALLAPGQVRAPSTVTVLFDAPGVAPATIGPNVQNLQSASASNAINPQTISLAAAVLGMLLIALVGVGGFTVIAQRRLRSLGMLGAIGATDQQVRLVVRANGVLVGVAGALGGFVIGLAGWLAYRPSLQASAHHLIGVFELPWTVIVPAMVLAVLATYLAAARPARAIARVPIVTALSGRPAPPKQVRRSVVPGIVALVLAGLLLGYGGTSQTGGGGPELLFGLVALVVALVLLAPACLALLGRLAGRVPVAGRLALRDLARYRSRSGSALAAISLGIMIAVLVCILSAQRFSNVLDYAGPNLASNQMIVYTPNGQNGPGGPNGPGNGTGGAVTGHTLASMAAGARGIATALGAHSMIELGTTSATLQHAASGRQFLGPVYVATPQLLRAFGIGRVDPTADVLTMRPGLSGISRMQLVYGDYFSHAPRNPNSYPCPPGRCLANPKIEQAGALPAGTSAPNTVITEHAVHQLGLRVSTAGWLIQAPHPPSAAQISNARLAAAAAGMTIETKSSTPSSAEIIDWATAFGILLALGILATTVGLIRSESAGDLRTLTATGAGSFTRRSLTATTAGALAFLGALLGTAVAYIGALAYSWSNPLDGLSALSSVPVTNLLIILIGMPLAGAAAGWLLAGREPPAIGHQPIE
jgi:putative ABC transport system permease protein